MAAATITFYNNFREDIADGSIDLDNDTFKVALLASGYTPNVETHVAYSDLTNELATANGYTQDDKALEGVEWTRSTTSVKFDADDVVWTASGGSIVARYAVIYSDTGEELVAYVLLDSAPADVTATDGNTLTVAWHANGIFTLTTP